MSEHIVFFDGECPLCHRSVRHLIEIDTRHVLAFAPLGGKTAEEVLSGPQKKLRSAQSIVLAENYRSTGRRFFVRSKAIFRIYWLIGKGWGLIGCLFFFPSFIGDFFYRWVAEHRHQFKLKMPHLPGPSERFLP